jgi:predicted MPP superfamily phosphohydrolase
LVAFALYGAAGWYAIVVTVAVALYTTLPLAVFLRSGGWSFYPTAAFRLLVMRPFWYAQLVLPVVAAGTVLGLIVGAAFGAPLAGARWFASIVSIAMATFIVAGYFGSRRLVVRELDASLPTLPPAFEGVTLAQISDLHIGPHTSRRHLRRVRDALRALAPDVIAVNGDLVDDRAEDVAHYAAAFGDLLAPLGVFITAGNHEIYAGWDDVERQLAANGIGTLLVNESRALRRGGDVVYLAGVGDPAAQRDAPRVAPDIDRTLASVPRGATVIAIAHNPMLWPALAEHGVALTLSGHTHWGQFAFPRLGWSLASPFLEQAMGPYQNGDALLYIAPGTGYFGIPFRIGATSEVTLVRLRRGPAALRVVSA